MGLSIGLLAVVLAQSPAMDGLERVVELELSPDDPVLLDRGGPTRVVEHTVQHDGELHVWASSAMGVLLRVDDIAEGRELRSDNGLKGGWSPYFELEVVAGQELAVFVAGPTALSEQPDRTARVHLVAAPETTETREVAARVRAAIEEALALREAGEAERARDLLPGLLSELLEVPGGATSDAVADTLWELGVAGYRTGLSGLAFESFDALHRHLERTRPEDNAFLLSTRGNVATAAESLGRDELALTLRASIVPVLERTRPPDDPNLQSARYDLAVSLQEAGEFAGALALWEENLAVLGPDPPDDAPMLHETRSALATGLYLAGETERAAAILNEVVAHFERTRPADDRDLLLARDNLAVVLVALGDDAGVLAMREEIVRTMASFLPDDHPSLLGARSNLGVSLANAGEHEAARALREEVLQASERVLPADHYEVQVARGHLADSLSQTGDPDRARELRRVVVEVFERTLPHDHFALVEAREDLADSLADAGEFAGALAQREAVHSVVVRTLPEEDPDRVEALENLATAAFHAGELERARELRESVLEIRERTLPPDHEDLAGARHNLANSLVPEGRLEEARALHEAALETYERNYPSSDPDLLKMRGGLASTLHLLGDYERARAIREDVLEVCERELPDDHPELIAARVNLANSVATIGDLGAARALRESALVSLERTLPPDHPDLLAARENLANSMWATGDVAGARAMIERVLAVRAATQRPDHPDLLRTRSNFSVYLIEAGELEQALDQMRQVEGILARTLPEDDRALLSLRENLATALWDSGDSEAARGIRKSILAAYERTLPDDHPDVLRARWNLAITLPSQEERAALRESVVAAYEEEWPVGHPERLTALSVVAVTDADAGRAERARERLADLCAGMSERVLGSLVLAPRESRGTVESEQERLSRAIFVDEHTGRERLEDLFELTETLRLVAVESARLLTTHDTDPELGPLLAEAAAARRALQELVVGEAGGPASFGIADELTRLSLERDRLEREAARTLAARGMALRPVELESVRDALADGEAFVGYRRVRDLNGDVEPEPDGSEPERLYAHVLRSDGGLARVDLGSAARLEELALAWREELGAPLLRGVAAVERDDEATAGDRLRARILDPVRAAAGDVSTLYVCADDLVFLLPLDALPLDAEGTERVGDRVRILNEVSIARLASREPPLETAPSLLALGGVDYDADPTASAGESRVIASASTRGSSGALPARFARLRQSQYEAEVAADLFEETFDVEPALFTREDATKAALFGQAPGRRYLHLATHGWFSPEGARSTADVGGPRLTLQERVTGFAPMTLCGLALAGANLGRDALGRVPGILTAEELCALDLSACDLAVLSACETNVGLRRAGQGIQSLQAALYAAGARSSITSLWKVDDAATRRLFEVFYTSLWEEGLSKTDALWRAKQALRDEGAPVRDWAAWVLSGEPE